MLSLSHACLSVVHTATELRSEPCNLESSQFLLPHFGEQDLHKVTPADFVSSYCLQLSHNFGFFLISFSSISFLVLFDLHCHGFLLHKPPHFVIRDNIRSKNQKYFPKAHVYKCVQVPCDSLCNMPRFKFIRKNIFSITSKNFQMCCNRCLFLLPSTLKKNESYVCPPKPSFYVFHCSTSVHHYAPENIFAWYNSHSL